MFSALFDRLSATLPSQCEVCHAWPSESVCADCIRGFTTPHPRCHTCALRVHDSILRCGACLTHPTALHACVAAVSYEYPWAGLISLFKFNNRPAWAAQIAQVMRANPEVQPVLDAAEVVIPMPLSAARLRARGYNQALLLAQALKASKLDSTVLLRIKETPALSLLDREDRLRAMTDAFAIDPLLAQHVRGKSIVLVDDVMTTGATLHGAATALRAAGANRVTGLVFARTEVN
jgi:ComF family protein